MFTVHGSASAGGARTAVCPAPVRRALLLAALVAGALCALWLAGAAPAGAAEGPGAHIAVPTGPLDPHAGAVAGLGGPLAETVATVGGGVDQARRTLEEPAAAQAPADPEEVARHLDETVRQVVTAPVAETVRLPEPSETTVPEPALRAPEPDDAPRPEPGTRDTRVEPATAPASAAEPAVAAPPAAGHPAAEAERAADTEAAVAASALGSSAPTTAPAAPSGTAAQAGGFIAGYLPVAAAPTPAPGLFQAARHVLRSVPAEDADEPTFSPD